MPVLHVGDRDSKQKLSPLSESNKTKMSVLIVMLPRVIALIGHPSQYLLALYVAFGEIKVSSKQCALRMTADMIKM